MLGLFPGLFNFRVFGADAIFADAVDADVDRIGGVEPAAPEPVEIELKSGRKYIERVPAEVWRYSPKRITKVVITDEPMVGLVQDPYWETADIDTSNNGWPRKLTPSRLELFKSEKSPKENLMRDFNTPLKAKGAAGDKDGES